MSGVGVSGLLANLPGTVTPYPTQDPALELGGYRSVANAAARDAIPANFRVVGMVTTLQDTGVSYELFGGLTNASWRVYVGAPLHGVYFVDPTFTGIQLGSDSNPFTSITAAFAAAVIAAWTDITIFQAPGTTTTENVTFPNTGEVSIIGLARPGNLSSCQITGNVAIPATASARRWLGDIRINGNVTGNTSAGTQRITFERVTVTGTTTLTVSGAGVVRLGTLGAVPGGGELSATNMAYTFLTGAVAVQGTVWAYTCQFGSTLSCSGRCIFTQCQLLGNVSMTGEANDDNDIVLINSLATNITINISQPVAGRLGLLAATDSNLDGSTFNFSGLGIPVFNLDQPTAQTMQQHGATMTGAPLPVPGTMSRAQLTAQTNNRAAATLCFKTPVKMLRMMATLTLVTPGTAGNAVLNAVFTDSLGTALRTRAVTSALNIAGAAGDEAQGTLVFQQDGSASIAYSVTGIVTPGALSYNLSVSVEPAC